MEFAEMQRIWGEQEKAPLYAINEDALLRRVRRKSGSTEFALNILEGSILFSSIVVIFILYLNWAGDNVPMAYHLIPAMLLIISGYALILRHRRRKKAQDYQPSLIGELEKAIAHNDFLLTRSKTILWWYILPVFGGFVLYYYFEKGPYWWQSILLTIAVGILAFFAGRWELRKFHEPKQRDFEALYILLTESGDVTGESLVSTGKSQ